MLRSPLALCCLGLAFSLNACVGEVGDLDREGFSPGVLPANIQELCESSAHEFPVVTHWNADADRQEYLAADKPSIYDQPKGPFVPGECNREYRPGMLPDFGSYIADTYSTTTISNERATDFYRGICDTTGVPFDFRRPDAFTSKSQGIGRLQSNSGRVQILHAKIIDGSLATIFLPPNWSFDANQSSYPIVVNGFYDINENVFNETGERWATMTALSGVHERTGVIGVLWNGGGALAARTTNAQAFRQFDSVIDYVAKNFSGDRHRIFMSGGSRGGLTALNMASNPYGYDYTVLFASATASPTLLGEHASLQSTTYPSLLAAVGWSTGFTDSWQTGWTYPACADRPALTGLTAAEAHSYVIVGTPDLAEADALYSPMSARFIEGLKAAGTQLFVTVTAHDAIVPYSTQVKYGMRLLEEKVPVTFEVIARAGHNERKEWGLLGHGPVRFDKMIQQILPHVNAGEAPLPGPALTYYKRNRRTDEFESYIPEGGFFPFSVDTPYKTAPGMRFPVAFVGHPGTEYRLDFHNPDSVLVLSLQGIIPPDLEENQWVDVPPAYPAGDYSMTLQIKKPEGDWQTIPSTNTITGEEAIVRVESEEPNVNGWEARTWAGGPALASGGTSWGFSEY